MRQVSFNCDPPANRMRKKVTLCRLLHQGSMGHRPHQGILNGSERRRADGGDSCRATHLRPPSRCTQAAPPCDLRKNSHRQHVRKRAIRFRSAACSTSQQDAIGKERQIQLDTHSNIHGNTHSITHGITHSKTRLCREGHSGKAAADEQQAIPRQLTISKSRSADTCHLSQLNDVYFFVAPLSAADTGILGHNVSPSAPTASRSSPSPPPTPTAPSLPTSAGAGACARREVVGGGVCCAAAAAAAAAAGSALVGTLDCSAAGTVKSPSSRSDRARTVNAHGSSWKLKDLSQWA